MQANESVRYLIFLLTTNHFWLVAKVSFYLDPTSMGAGNTLSFGGHLQSARLGLTLYSPFLVRFADTLKDLGATEQLH